MNPFSKYLECINCGNELISINELTFRTPEKIECDFCGQDYPGLDNRVRKTKILVNTVFLLVCLVLFAVTWKIAGIIPGLFSLFPVFLIYLFVLGFTVHKNSGLSGTK